MSGYICFPRNQCLSPSEKEVFDEYSRQMSKVMIQIIDESRHYERLAKQSLDSSESGCGSYSSSGSESSCHSPSSNFEWIPNPFYDSFYSTTLSTGFSSSPTPHNLVPNPFYDPSYAASTSTSSMLVTNPFYDPKYGLKK